MTLPTFIDNNPEQITRELIASYEAMTGKTLYPGQVERLLIDLWAYRESLTRSAINDAARQNLVRFARAPMLDYLGELVGVTRLPARPARTQVRVSFAAPLVSGLMIEAGRRAETGAGVQFAAAQPVVAPAGATSVELAVVAVVPGMAGNGYVPGQLNRWVDELPVESTLANITVTSGGANQETDDRLRERIMLAPESFSVAGSRLAYRHHAMSAHPDIVDVAVTNPEPGVVRLHPLMRGGALPDAAVLAAVLATCSDEKVRPLTDTVETAAPEVTNYALNAHLTLFYQGDQERVLASATAAAEALTEKLRTRLGQDVVPSQFVAALSVPGVYRVDLPAPATLLAVPEQGVALCTGIHLQLAGVTHG